MIDINGKGREKKNSTPRGLEGTYHATVAGPPFLRPVYRSRCCSLAVSAAAESRAARSRRGADGLPNGSPLRSPFTVPSANGVYAFAGLAARPKAPPFAFAVGNPRARYSHTGPHRVPPPLSRP